MAPTETASATPAHRDATAPQHPPELDALIQKEADQLLRTEADLHRELFLEVGRLHRRHLMDALADFDLTPGQYHTLSMLAQHKPGIAMSDLAAATYHVLPTMTGIINRLVERALVERRPDETDRRTRRVYLTETGQALLVQIDAQRRQQAIQILEYFTPADRRELIRLMQQYLDVIHAIDSNIPPKPED